MKFAFQGLKHCFRTENNFRIHLLATVAVSCLGFLARLDETKWCLLIFCIGFVICSEILNTAIEKLVDLVSPEYNKQAGIIKDISAGAVLVSAVIAAVTGCIIFYDYFLLLLQ